MAKLRDPNGGCPWDLEQDFASIAPYTLEEAYEVADAIQRNDMADLQEELGDLLLQVVFHSQMAREAGLFDFEDVARTINEKMVRRHPHVFPQPVISSDSEKSISQISPSLRDVRNDGIKTADDQITNWETIKQQEKADKGHDSVLDDVPVALPALVRAQKLTKKAAKVGFDWPDIAPVFDKLQEEIAELKEATSSGNTEHMTEELGDILFVCANLARHLKTDAETALRGTNAKFERRFRYVEQQLAAQGKSPETATLAEMDALWDEAKAAA